MSSDRSVILRSLEEPRAFGELFDRHAGTLHRFIARRADGVVADDVVGETFLRAFEQRDRFSQDREDALPWLFGVALALNVLRRHRRADLRFVPAAGRRLGAERHLAVVLAAVRRMPKRSRDVLLHRVQIRWGGASGTSPAGTAARAVRGRTRRPSAPPDPAPRGRAAAIRARRPRWQPLIPLRDPPETEAVHRVDYAGTAFLTDSRIAHALFEYARVLAAVGQADVVRVPGVDDDDLLREYELIIGPSSQMITHEIVHPLVELPVAETLQDLSARSAQRLPELGAGDLRQFTAGERQDDWLADGRPE